jgi:formiminotetrahydrofolate cyclodeaminase
LNHPGSGSLLDLTLGELLDRLGSSDPTPGGGAAAALVGALGAALIEMTANLTIGKPRFAEVEDLARQIERRASELRRELARLGDADADAFERVSAAYKLPHADDAQTAHRSAAIQQALHVAADVPLQTARLSAEVIALGEQAAPLLNPSVISDVMVGTILARAALDGAAVNVDINVAAMADAAASERLETDLSQIRSNVDERVRKTLEAGQSRFPTRRVKKA